MISTATVGCCEEEGDENTVAHVTTGYENNGGRTYTGYMASSFGYGYTGHGSITGATFNVPGYGDVTVAIASEEDLDSVGVAGRDWFWVYVERLSSNDDLPGNLHYTLNLTLNGSPLVVLATADADSTGADPNQAGTKHYVYHGWNVGVIPDKVAGSNLVLTFIGLTYTGA